MPAPRRLSSRKLLLRTTLLPQGVEVCSRFPTPIRLVRPLKITVPGLLMWFLMPLYLGTCLVALQVGKRPTAPSLHARVLAWYLPFAACGVLTISVVLPSLYLIFLPALFPWVVTRISSTLVFTRTLSAWVALPSPSAVILSPFLSPLVVILRPSPTRWLVPHSPSLTEVLPSPLAVTLKPFLPQLPVLSPSLSPLAAILSPAPRVRDLPCSSAPPLLLMLLPTVASAVVLVAPLPTVLEGETPAETPDEGWISDRGVHRELGRCWC